MNDSARLCQKTKRVSLAMMNRMISRQMVGNGLWFKSGRGSVKSAFRFLGSAACANIDCGKLVVERTSAPKPKVPNEELVFGRTFTDHMLEIDWSADSGWKAPRILPYHKLELDPAASSLHYALQLFEGMKAYLDSNGDIRLFRPELNMDRMHKSAERLCFPVNLKFSFSHVYIELIRNFRCRISTNMLLLSA